ncbi:MAG: sigma-70 family RNA polymerase sigma factor [Terriglobia bacterium]
MGQNEEGAVVSTVQEKASLGMAELDDFDLLVRQHQRRIYRVLLGMVRDPDAAETLTQECFFRAYRNRASFRGESSAGVWLFKIAVNLARDHRRSRLRGFWQRLFSSADDASEAGERLPDSHASPEKLLLLREDMTRVWSAIEVLSPRQRAVFIFRFVEEMTLEEIAESTSLKVGTVKAHLFRAVNAVRQRLKEGAPNE